MSALPIFESSPVHLREREDLRLRLLLCAEELRFRYDGAVWLCGSGVAEADPKDWDVRVVVSNVVFDSRGHHYWSLESALRTQAQCRSNKLNFDIRIFPSRLWYQGDALRLDTYEVATLSGMLPEVADVPGLDAADIEHNKKIIAEHCKDPKFHILIGSMMFLRGDKQTALQAFTRSVQLDPTFPGGWLNIGNVSYDACEFRKAAIYYRRALALDPTYAKAYINLANTLVQLGVHAAAVPLYERAIQLDGHEAAAHHNKANCLTALKEFVEAESELNYALELAPGDDKILNTLGNLRSTQGDLYAAGAAYNLAIRVSPKYAPLYTNVANIYMSLGRSKEAILNYERGLILEPKNPGIRYNLALAYLRAGNYRLGWKAYEGRWGFRELSTKPRDFKCPMWRGEDLHGKRILIHAEQGMGDTFQFARYVPLVAQLGGTVFFEVQHRLQRLMVTVPGVKLVLTRGLTLPETDLHCPLMSLPYIFKTDVGTVPLNIPYVSAWRWEVEQMHKLWPQSGFRIGINWAGNPRYKKDKERSFSLGAFAPLMDVDGVVWLSLQRGPMARQLDKYKDSMPVLDASSNAKDFAETAALIETLDLVITSDSSPMHLAAAMNKEVWLLLSYLPDWRWMESGTATPWYPKVRIFRQTSEGDWAGLFERVRVALEERLKTVQQSRIMDSMS